MPIEEFKARADRIRVEMRHRGMDALLLYGNGLDECGYPTYVSNYTVKLPFAALVIVPAEGDAILMFEGSTRGRSAAQATTWIEDMRPCWNIAETCVTALSERELLSAAVGLAGVHRLMPYEQWDLLSTALAGAKLMDAEPFVDKLRGVKSTREIAQVRAASQIVRTTFDDLESAHFDAVMESLLAAHLIRHARMQGAEDVRVMIGHPMRPPEDSAIGESETIVVLLRASWERYWAEATRTYKVQSGRFEPVWSDSDAAVYKSIVQRFAAGQAIAELLCTGHGIGVAPVEPPLVLPDGATSLEAGMCLAICAALPSGAVRGETIVIGSQNPSRS